MDFKGLKNHMEVKNVIRDVRVEQKKPGHAQNLSINKRSTIFETWWK